MRGVLFVLGLFAARSASAEEAQGPIVLVASHKAPPPAARALAERLAHDLSGPDAAATAAAIDSAFPPATPRTWDTGPLLSKVAAARDDYYEGRFAKAAPALGEVGGMLAGRIDRIGGVDRLAAPLFASQMMHAIALVRTGRTAEATDVLRAAHRLFPERRPSVTEFGPELVQIWEGAIPGASGEARVRVEASLGRRPCIVRWNGREVGTSPATFRVPQGATVIGAVCGQTESRLRRPVVVPGERTIRIDVALDAAIETTDWVGLRSAGEREDARAAASVAAAVGASRVALLRVDGGEVHATLFDVDRRGRSIALVEGRAAIADRAALEALSDELASRAPPPEPAHDDSVVSAGAAPPPPADSGSGRTWWIAAGAGGVVAAAGGALLLLGRSSAVDALSATSAQSRLDAEDAAGIELTLGALFFPAGIGAALAGGALYFLPPDGRGLFRGPLYTALLVGGAVVASLGVSLLLQDECEPFDALCSTQGPEPGGSTSPWSFVVFGAGVASSGAAIALRLREVD